MIDVNVYHVAFQHETLLLRSWFTLGDMMIEEHELEKEADLEQAPYLTRKYLRLSTFIHKRGRRHPQISVPQKVQFTGCSTDSHSFPTNLEGNLDSPPDPSLLAQNTSTNSLTGVT